MLRKIRDLLRLLDLTETQVSVYLALLRLQNAMIPMIRHKCGLPNITVYRTILALEEQGFIIAETINGKQKMFAPLSLAALAKRLESKERRLGRMARELKNLDGVLPYLTDDDHAGEAEIEIRSGFDAFREEYLKMPFIFQDEYLHLGNAPEFWKTAKLDYDAPEERWFIRKRLQKNLYARALDIPSQTAEMIQRNDSREKRTMRLVKNLPIMKDFLMIAEKQVSHFVNDRDDPRVVIIRNPELVGAHRAQFDMLWAQKNA